MDDGADDQTARAVEVRVRGRVQGVFFRDSCRRRAEAADVRGWVRNDADGSVLAHLEGTPTAVEELVAWMRDGPRDARVDSLEVDDVEPTDLATFEVREGT